MDLEVWNRLKVGVCSTVRVELIWLRVISWLKDGWM
jgi:hypothetical protein